MSFFEELQKGSPFHSVGERSERGFSIIPVDDGDDSFDAFQRVVLDAIANAGVDYEIRPHETTQRGRRMYDKAAIMLI
jgi:uncharacterized protein YqgV (UPF0045/DUF77 family)